MISIDEPRITVGIVDGRKEVRGRLNGPFTGNGSEFPAGRFEARVSNGSIGLYDENQRQIARSSVIRLIPAHEDSTFSLFGVTIGIRFHWERREDQTFHGQMVLLLREDGTVAAINDILLEDYLKAVICSEMRASAPAEFLKAHAVLSRSWLLAALKGKKEQKERFTHGPSTTKQGEVIRWYDREDHDLFDVCADDHCQRYQGIAKITSGRVEDAVRETRGMVLTYQDEICDARYSKACGAFTEEFSTAWEDRRVPYLRSISDSPHEYGKIRTEDQAVCWILSNLDAYCNTKDTSVLEAILPNFDLETQNFFRWRVEYPRKELEDILRDKSGFDFGRLQQISPLTRGPSGRISRLRIVGSKMSIIVGKELEIRRWLSRSHLYSSAFIVKEEADRFVFHGAGWGHGVGLCQIGAAVMASRGFSAGHILKHYFRGAEIEKVY